jgi:ABC-type uncharacterized transport system permease subunit
MLGILPHLLGALLYAGLAYYFWRTRWAQEAGIPHEPAAAGGFEQHAVLLPLGVHTVLLGQAVFGSDGLYLGVGNAISTILWLTVLIYWVGNFFYKLEGLQALVMPAAAIAVLLPVVIPSLHVLLMALIERQLHGGALPRLLQRLPPLLTMETLLFRIIWVGFALLTLTLASGVMYSEELFGKAAKFNHKTVFGVLSWIIFAWLLVGRHAYGWRGRIAVRWTLAGFLTLVLAYIGSKFVLEVILGRG